MCASPVDKLTYTCIYTDLQVGCPLILNLILYKHKINANAKFELNNVVWFLTHLDFQY